MTTQDKILAAKAEFDRIMRKGILTTSEMDRLGLLGRRLYRLRKSVH
jgi:hypothetical protein